MELSKAINAAPIDASANNAMPREEDEVEFIDWEDVFASKLYRKRFPERENNCFSSEKNCHLRNIPKHPV